jgi:hypothetical protein
LIFNPGSEFSFLVEVSRECSISGKPLDLQGNNGILELRSSYKEIWYGPLLMGVWHHIFSFIELNLDQVDMLFMSKQD